jgi:hypothetical protein
MNNHILSKEDVYRLVYHVKRDQKDYFYDRVQEIVNVLTGYKNYCKTFYLNSNDCIVVENDEYDDLLGEVLKNQFPFQWLWQSDYLERYLKIKEEYYAAKNREKQALIKRINKKLKEHFTEEELQYILVRVA